MDILHEITHHVSPPSPKQGYLSFFIINVKLNVARPGIPDNVISNNGPQITCREFAHRHTWLFQLLPVSTVPNTEKNISNSNYRGLDEEEFTDVGIRSPCLYSMLSTIQRVSQGLRPYKQSS